MPITSQTLAAPEARAFYRRSMTALAEAGVPFLVGGAYAFERYTGIERHTKDFDIFVRRADCARALDALAATGCATELPFPHWLGKARSGEYFVDVIFSSGNAIAAVDDEWFEHSVEETVFDVAVRLCPAEEMIWSKSFVMERERYDGADVAHLIRASGKNLDWLRLVRRFGPHWRVLLRHLTLFGFIYPAERSQVPRQIMLELIDRLGVDVTGADDDSAVCRGTLVSRGQYLIDIERWGYTDARLSPTGNMSDEEIAHWTRGIEVDEDPRR